MMLRSRFVFRELNQVVAVIFQKLAGLRVGSNKVDYRDKIIATKYLSRDLANKVQILVRNLNKYAAGWMQ